MGEYLAAQRYAAVEPGACGMEHVELEWDSLGSDRTLQSRATSVESANLLAAASLKLQDVGSAHAAMASIDASLQHRAPDNVRASEGGSRLTRSVCTCFESTR